MAEYFIQRVLLVLFLLAQRLRANYCVLARLLHHCAVDLDTRCAHNPLQRSVQPTPPPQLDGGGP
jgi:hypothetical protein